MMAVNILVGSAKLKLIGITGTDGKTTTAYLVRALLEGVTDTRDAAYLAYAIGKEYEDLDKPSEAFAAWSQGARPERARDYSNGRANRNIYP